MAKIDPKIPDPPVPLTHNTGNIFNSGAGILSCQFSNIAKLEHLLSKKATIPKIPMDPFFYTHYCEHIFSGFTWTGFLTGGTVVDKLLELQVLLPIARVVYVSANICFMLKEQQESCPALAEEIEKLEEVVVVEGSVEEAGEEDSDEV